MAVYIHVNPIILPEYALDPLAQEAIHSRHRDFQGRIHSKSVQLIPLSECRHVQSASPRTRRNRRITPY
jgi:hypothetical protein